MHSTFWQKALLAFGFLVAFCGMPAAHAESDSVSLQTEPKNLIPFEAEAKTQQTPPTLIFDAPANSKLHLDIELPQPTPWLSTDFPIVEGCTLLQMDTTVGKSGLWSLQSMLPIRGNYKIPIEIERGDSTQTKTLDLNVNENPSKYLYFAGLVAILFIIGAVGGYIIAGKQQIHAGQLAPTRVELLISGASVIAVIAMVWLAVSAEMNIHHHCATGEKPTAREHHFASNAKYFIGFSDRTGEIQVGDLAPFAFRVTDNTAHRTPIKDVPVHVQITQLEDNFQDLAFTSATDSAGKIAWKQCFFDGSPYKLEVTLPGSPDLKVLETVQVVAIHPPLSRRLITLAYIMLFLAIGMFVGFVSKTNRRSESKKINDAVHAFSA